MQNGLDAKVKKILILTNYMCKIHQTWAFLTDWSKKMKETKVFQLMIWVHPWGSFRKGWGCEVLSTRANVFFHPYFKLRTIFRGYDMILKQENNLSDRVNDPVSKGKKDHMLTPMEFDCKMARKRKWKKFTFYPIRCVRFIKLNRSLQIRRKRSKETKVFQVMI